MNKIAINPKIKQFFHNHIKDIEDRDFSGMIEDIIWNYKDKEKDIFNIFKTADINISDEEIKESMYNQGLSKAQYRVIDLYNNDNPKSENKIIKDLTYKQIQLGKSNYDAYEMADKFRDLIGEILQQGVNYSLDYINLSSQNVECINFYLVDINNVTHLSIDIGDCLKLVATSDYIADLLYVVYGYAIAFDEDNYTNIVNSLIRGID